MTKVNAVNPEKPSKFIDELKERRIFEHITNKDDLITEDDIRNVRTDVLVNADNSSEDNVPVKNKKRRKL